jgi:hypothetical protein
MRIAVRHYRGYVQNENFDRLKALLELPCQLDGSDQLKKALSFMRGIAALRSAPASSKRLRKIAESGHPIDSPSADVRRARARNKLNAP